MRELGFGAIVVDDFDIGDFLSNGLAIQIQKVSVDREENPDRGNSTHNLRDQASDDTCPHYGPNQEPEAKNHRPCDNHHDQPVHDGSDQTRTAICKGKTFANVSHVILGGREIGIRIERHGLNS